MSIKYDSVAIIPIKQKSERLKDKNFRLLIGKPLYEIFLDKVSHCNFDKIFVDTDSTEVKVVAKEKYNYDVIDRIEELAADNANGNDLLNYHATLISANVYFQLFVTAPLLKHETINRAIRFMSEEKNYDSLFTAHQLYSWFWFDGVPVNYDPGILPRSQDAVPVVRETTGLYAIRRRPLEKLKRRIGENPYHFYVDFVEALDLDNEIDFLIAEMLMSRK